MSLLRSSRIRNKSPLQRALGWWWVPAIPAGLFALFVVFLGLNRVGNEFPSSGAALDEFEAPTEPFETAYVRDPELYFTVWQRDTTEGRRQMVAAWQAELSELKVRAMTGEGTRADDPEHIERIQQLSQAVRDLEKRP